MTLSKTESITCMYASIDICCIQQLPDQYNVSLWNSFFIFLFYCCFLQIV